MSVIAYDSASPQHIPVNAAAVFPYSDGSYAWSHARFPRARYRYITVRGDVNSDIADYEEGAVFGAAALRTWANDRLEKHGNHADLTVYCDKDNFPAVKAAMAGFTWHLFLSTLDGTQPQSYDGMQCRAVQYTDRSDLYDMSVVWDESWLNR